MKPARIVLLIAAAVLVCLSNAFAQGVTIK